MHSERNWIDYEPGVCICWPTDQSTTEMCTVIQRGEIIGKNNKINLDEIRCATDRQYVLILKSNISLMKLNLKWYARYLQ